MKIYQQEAGGITGDFVIRRGSPENTVGLRVTKDGGNGQAVREMIRDITPTEYGFQTRDTLGGCVNVGMVWDVPDSAFWQAAKGFSEYLFRRLRAI